MPNHRMNLSVSNRTCSVEAVDARAAIGLAAGQRPFKSRHDPDNSPATSE